MDRSSYVVVEGYVSVRLHFSLYLASRFEPGEVLVFVLRGALLVLFLLLLSFLNHLLYWIDDSAIFHEILLQFFLCLSLFFFFLLLMFGVELVEGFEDFYLTFLCIGTAAPANCGQLGLRGPPIIVFETILFFGYIIIKFGRLLNRPLFLLIFLLFFHYLRYFLRFAAFLLQIEVFQTQNLLVVLYVIIKTHQRLPRLHLILTLLWFPVSIQRARPDILFLPIFLGWIRFFFLFFFATFIIFVLGIIIFINIFNLVRYVPDVRKRL